MDAKRKRDSGDMDEDIVPAPALGFNGAASASAAAPTQPAPAAAAAAAPLNETDLAGEDLRTFLSAMDDFTPTIPDAVTTYYLQRGGFTSSDPRVIKMVSLATQKFIFEIAQNALHHCKHRQAGAQAKKPVKERQYIMTTADLTQALRDAGINALKPPYLS